MSLPPQPVPKTRQALAAYEDDGNEVPLGIWYEVAIAEYLLEVGGAAGLRIHLYPWGSYEDTRLGKDALIFLPAPYGFAVAVDFTTDDRFKQGHTFKIDKRWFSGERATLKVEPDKLIKQGGRLLRVKDAVRATFYGWADRAFRDMPRQEFPE